MDDYMRDYLRAARFERPDRIPIGAGVLPATKKRHGQALYDLMDRYPRVFGTERHDSPENIQYPTTYRAGKHVDAWGCVWENISDGYESIVTGHPVPTREDIHALKAPEADAGLPHGFMFLRLTDLRGFEEAMIDFAEEPPELQMLIDIVLAYNMRQLELRLANHDGPIMYFGDDLGTQKALPISPAQWRKYLKPCYMRLYKRCKEAGKLVYMHTDGCIHEIIPDLIECGVDILNPQIRANGLDNLVRTCRGKVCVDLDLDRQLFPFAAPEEIMTHVMDCTKALYTPEGGLMLKGECGGELTLETIEAICEAMMAASEYHG